MVPWSRAGRVTVWGAKLGQEVGSGRCGGTAAQCPARLTLEASE